MIQSLIFMVSGVTLPVAALVLCHPRLRGRFSLFFPLGIVLHAAFMGVGASLLASHFGTGVPKTFLVIALSSAVTLVWLVKASRLSWRISAAPPIRLLAMFALLALIFTADELAIFAKNRWNFETNALFPAETTHFRFPLNSDNRRHVIVVSTLLRDGMSPFLANSPLRYQVHWHHLASLFVGPFHPFSFQSYVSGTIVATSFLFFFILFWGLACLRPAIFQKARWILPLAILAACHVELLNLAGSLFLTQQPGIAADGSFPSLISINFSLKVAALTAPQHLFFLLLVLAYFVGVRLLREPTALLFVATFLGLAFLASPVLFAPLAFFLIVAELLERRVEVFKWLLILAICVAGFRLAWGFFPFEIIFRKVPMLNTGFLGEARHWKAVFLLWIAMGGSVGLIVTLLFIRRIHARRWPREAIALSLAAGTLGIHLLIRGSEFYRHWSILCSLLGVLFLVREIPKRKSWLNLVYASALLAIPAHAYFLYCYLGKPSIVEADIAWRDYFEFNQILRTKYPQTPVVSAIFVAFTPVMEAATSFATAADSCVHARVSPEQFRSVTAAERDGILPHAKRLGYHYLLWGPLEQGVWSGREKCRFLDERNIVEKKGSVALYRIEDALADHRARKPGATSQDHFSLAVVLTLSGWVSEGLEEFWRGFDGDPVRKSPGEWRSAVEAGIQGLVDRDRRYFAKCHIRPPLGGTPRS